MGSANFALPALNALLEAGFDIAAVVTQPDRPRGRGQALQGPPVKQLASSLNLPIYQPDSLKTEEIQRLFHDLAPDLIVVVAYGKILPAWLLTFPRYGCINVHGSLLPKYRGAAPVHWAIAKGETSTGVCTMRMDQGLDTGPVFLCEQTSIAPEETTVELYDRLAQIGGPLIVKTVKSVLDGTLHPQPQDDTNATFAPRLRKQDGFLNWGWPAHEIYNRVRAFNPWPGTVTRFREQNCKISKTAIGLETEWQESSADLAASEPGALLLTKGRLAVVCGDKRVLEILSIQPENRKPMSGGDFVNGLRVRAGEKFVPLKDN